MYYGTEQKFDGGNDPDDREPLWPTNLDTSGDMYHFVSTLNNARAEQKWWNEEQVERWADDSFYAFTRGTTLVAMANSDSGDQTRTITYSPYKAGDVLTNIFDESDKVTVDGDRKSVV